ncbi:MAG: diacylglycerol kinase family protein [Patescibacteria group bacterium]|jgi:diacylglycerol kinase
MLQLSRQIFNSFRYAFRGVKEVYRTELNFRLQITASLLVLLFVLLFQVRPKDAAILFLMMALVLILELVNTALERFVDLVKPRVHIYARSVKDIMAAAVLIASLFSLAIGLLIMWPYVSEALAGGAS